MRAAFALTTIAILSVLSTIAGIARAEPNKADPGAPLSTHGTIAAATDIASEAYALVADAEKVLDQSEKAIASGKPERIAAKQVGQAAVKTAQAERLGLQLVDMGEPAGIDIHLRLVQVRKRTATVVNAYRATPAGSKLIQVLSVQMGRGTAARVQVAKKIEEQAAKSVPQAERALYKALDSLHAAAVFDPGRGQMSMYTPFNEAQQFIESAVARSRREQTRQHCAELFGSVQGKATGWLAEAAAAANSIQQSGQASINGNLVSGPQALQHFGDQWGLAHGQLMQASGLLMITSSTAGEQYSASGTADNSPSVVQPILDLERRLADQAGQVLAQIILSDVQHATAETAGQKYSEYLTVLAPMQRRASGSMLSDACGDPLTRLAEKAHLQTDIETYRQATGELLRWRKRLADKQLAPVQPQFTPLPTLTRQTFQSRANYVGLYPLPGTAGRSGPVTATLRGSAMDTLTPVLPDLVGQAVVATNVLRISPSSRSTIAQHLDRTYANMPVPVGVEPFVNAFKKDLLVDEAHPALTLETVSASQSAEWGEFAMVGGRVANVHLEGLVTRLRTLPAVASIFALRGELPETERLQHENYLDQVIVRYDIVPTWVRHDYFVATIPQSNDSNDSNDSQ